MEHHPVWIPGVPVTCESDSTEMASLEETFAARSSRGQQLVHYTDASTPSYEDDPFGVFEIKALELERDHDQWGMKMHRYPENIGEVGEQYTVPMIVSIGPYHHGRHQLKKAEEAKHVAAYSCIKHSGLSVQEMHDAVVSVADEARSLYDKETVAGIEDDDFLPMMFYDACFLVQFMLWSSTKGTMHPWVEYFLKSKKDDIYHDILLLENQLPWVVLKTLARCTSVNLENFAKGFKLHNSGSLDVVSMDDLEAATTHDSTLLTLYKPPHLLGYVRFYIVGTKKSETYQPHKETKVKSFSVHAMELAEMGITLTPSKTTKLAHMGFKEGRLWDLSAELFLPPILLTYARASYLFNMAAFEMTSQARPEHGEDTAVCSYVQLLGMLMDREKDVQELRSKRILQGGGGLTDKETLDFFTSLRVIRGPLYHRTIRDVEMYKQNSRTWVKVYTFWYKYKKTVLAVVFVIATLLGIYGTLRKR
uniref:Uncharacterized protein n=1 Tax=Avena sativa TaxID=4498 RepID=A0ACD5ZYP3_AVESA